MAASQDIQLSIKASLRLSCADAIAACMRAAESLEEAECRKISDEKITITLHSKVYRLRASRCASPVVGVSLAQVDGGTRLTTAVEAYWTYQSFFFGIVPFGPKFLIGVKGFKQLLDGLEEELRKVDPHAEVERVTVPNSVTPTGNVKG